MSGPFERTRCACSECVACCHRQPGYLVLDDVKAISEYLDEPAEPFLVRSKGSLLGQMTPHGMRLFRVGTITPRRGPTGGCVFLDEEDRCVIHPVAPFGCAMFDTHQLDDDGRRRWGVIETMRPEYQAKRNELDDGEEL